MNQHCYIIAEAGVNHNGSLDRAIALIDAAAAAGADAVKFQTFKSDKLVTRTAEKASYQENSHKVKESQHAMLQKLELSHQDHFEIIKHCEYRGIQFLSTAFDSDSAEFLSSLSLPFVKIPSGEITNLPHLRSSVSPGRVIILSTGMATLGEIEQAINILIKSGASYSDIIVLQCHTDYPTRFEDANLRAMLTIGAAFPGVRIGYSDHTMGIEVPIAAVAMGACLIEKHFTMDRNLPGPDHSASLEPSELAAMIAAIRNVETALGHGRKEPSFNEMKIKSVARKSIVAARAIQQNELFSDQNLTVKRPGTGVSPMCWDDLMGKPANRYYAADELIDFH